MINLYLDRIIPWSVMLPITVGFIYYPKLGSGSRLILVYTLVAALFNLSAVALAHRFHNNMPVFHLYAVFEFILCTLFFRQVLMGTKMARYIPHLIIGFILFSILNSLFLQNIYSFNSYPRSLSAFVSILFCLVFMYRSLDPRMMKADHSRSTLLISLGLFLYFSGSLLLFIFGQILNHSRTAAELGWGIHASLILLMYVLFSFAFYKSGIKS